MLSLNNLTNLSANIPFVVATKCIILDNLLQTTRITSFLTTNSNFVIKSTIKCVYSPSSTLFNFKFPVGTSVLFFILWHISYFSIYHPTITNFIQLVSLQPVDRFSQTKLHWKALNEGYLHICGIYKSDNKQLRYQAISNCKSFISWYLMNGQMDLYN